jgi:hypothetical protein
MDGMPEVRRLVRVLALCGLATACGSKLNGTYTNPSGIAMLEIKSGGKATMGLGGETRECTYTEDGKQLRLTCGGDRIAVRINDDGSLFMPGFAGVMRKSK